MIAINNMNMPKSCEDCRCTFDRFDGSTKCILGAKRIDWTKRPKDCPLVECTRPCGEWILIDDVNDPLDQLNRYKCSECGRIIRIYDWQTFADYPFCQCGADMRKDINDTDCMDEDAKQASIPYTYKEEKKND